MSTANIWGITGNWAEVYHSCFVPTIIAPWVEHTLALAAPRPGERLLDVACGSGVVTRQAARMVGASGRVVGLDLSPEALAVARSLNGPDGGATIAWREGSADSLPFADGSFDVVTCQLGLMFFPDRVAALKEMRRVLAAGGRLALMTWGALDKNLGNAAMAAAWGERVGAEQAAKLQPPHSLNDPAEVRRLLNAAGFAQIDVQRQEGRAHFPSPQALVYGYGALAGLEADAALRDSLCADVARLLDVYCSTHGLDYPTEAVLGWAQQSVSG
ncbi:MAG: class I SAM-dependent methyltransferase [Chloroflexi bacterium]|nr:class I SAM-dependent methyltransferase [Chloroflexota bacterium]